ncbi:MAG: rod shape-determining protein MreD [Clostridia bacterium]|nr:rod shape-determining protein MreD [Clostridia bacterium]
MIRRILPFLLIAIVFLLDTSLLPALTDFWLVPVFGLALVHSLGLLLGRTRGVLYGMIMGLLVDITVSTPLGLMTAIYALMGYAGGWFGRVMWRSRLAPVISATACFALYEIVMDIYVVLMSLQFETGLLLRSMARLPVYVALVYGGQFLLNRLLRPSRSRFAPR